MQFLAWLLAVSRIGKAAKSLNALGSDLTSIASSAWMQYHTWMLSTVASVAFCIQSLSGNVCCLFPKMICFVLAKHWHVWHAALGKPVIRLAPNFRRTGATNRMAFSALFLHLRTAVHLLLWCFTTFKCACVIALCSFATRTAASLASLCSFFGITCEAFLAYNFWLFFKTLANKRARKLHAWQILLSFSML